MSKQTLLLDVILLVIDQLAPSSSIVALPPFHITTRTLHSLALTSRGTSLTAVRLLLTHCLYIDKPWRLKPLLSYLAAHPNSSPSFIHSLYLAPYPTWSINDVAICNEVYRLLSILAPSLKRLVLDVPFRSLYPEDDHDQVRPILREAFEKLAELEIFCSAQDELYLSHKMPPEYFDQVWPSWPKLRILALYNSDITEVEGWKALARLEFLETLVLTRSDGQDDVDVKTEWRRVARSNRPLTILMVNIEEDHLRRPLRGKKDWVEDEIVVKEINVPISYYGDEDVIDLCQEWVKKKILRGVPVEEWD